MSRTCLQGRWVTAGITVACGCGFLLFGFDQGVFGGILTNNEFLKQFNNPDATIQGQITSSYYLGAVFGAAVSHFVGDKIGRRRAILAGCTLLIIGGALQASAFQLAHMIVGRVVGGFGTGLNTTAIPMWQVETSKAAHRGRLVILELVLNIFGIVITCWMNYGFTYVPHNSISWRFPLAMQCFFALLTFCLVLLMPESPRWLILRDRHHEAQTVVALLRNKPRDHPDVVSDFNAMADTVAHEAQNQGKFFDEVIHGGPTQTLRRVALGAGTGFMQQLCGTNVMANYLPVVLTRSVGLPQRLSLILAACNNISLMFFGALAMLFIDKLGRKKLMLLGAISQSISFFLVAIGIRVGTNSMSVFAVVFIFVYYAFYGLSYLSIPWLYPAEINSQRMRNTGTSISTCTNWLFVYVVVLITPIGIQNLGWRFYLIFGFFNAAFLPAVWFFYLETAGLTLEQIDRVFEINYESGGSISLKVARKQAIAETLAGNVTWKNADEREG